MAKLLPTIIAPVRLASTRLPNKPLYMIAGKPLVIHVAERLTLIAPEYPLYFAVDSQQIADVLSARGFKSIITDPALPSGSDRIAAANRQIKAKFVINCQGDEPRLERNHIELLTEALATGVPMATLALSNFTAEEFANPNRPKVVIGANGNALYFSRSGIPYWRDQKGAAPIGQEPCVGLHQGIYAYTGEFLEKFTQLPQTSLEKLEKLEQLRALEHGYTIAVRLNTSPTIGIDTPEDVAVFEKALAQKV